MSAPGTDHPAAADDGTDDDGVAPGRGPAGEVPEDAGPGTPVAGSANTGRWPRATLEFDRVAFFSDAVFAIAMTLLIVGVGVPLIRPDDVSSSQAMWDALRGKENELISFAIGFVVIGRYWVAQHSSFGLLGAVDRPYTTVTMLYLAVIAYLPFPTGLIGRYEENLVAFAIYASSLAIASAMSALLFHLAYRDGLLRVPVSPDAYRWWMVAALSPIAVFGISIVVAAFFGSTWGLLSFLLFLPFGKVLDRFRTEGVDAIDGRRRNPRAR